MTSRAETLRMVEAFHLEHIVAGSRGGPSKLDNLAWACPAYNLHKPP